MAVNLNQFQEWGIINTCLPQSTVEKIGQFYLIFMTSGIFRSPSEVFLKKKKFETKSQTKNES